MAKQILSEEFRRMQELAGLKETKFDTSLIKGEFKIGATRNANSGIVRVLTPVKVA